jgi:pimeloyl-ACP methyl ester carboxylesterase
LSRASSPHKNNEPGEKKSKGWLPLAGFAFGVVAFVLIIYFVGLETISEPLGRIGLGFFWIVLLNFLRHYLRAVNLYIAVPRKERGFGIAQALAARHAGETINTIAFTGPVLGDAAKASMLERDVPLEHTATAVIIDEIIYYISSLLLIIAGAIVVLYSYGGGIALNLILFGLVLFSIVVLAGMWWVVRKNITPISWLIKKTTGRWFMPRALARRRDDIEDVESNVIQFHDERPRTFMILTAIILLTHVLSVFEAFWAMRMLGLEVTVAGAFIVESLTKAVNFVFFLIPGTVGAYEGGNSLILTSLGYTAGAGVALALVRRGGILFWTLIGGIILLWRGAKRSAEQIMESEAE